MSPNRVPLSKLTKAELERMEVSIAQNVSYSLQNVVEELDRRGRRQHETLVVSLLGISVGVSLLSIVLSIVF